MHEIEYTHSLKAIFSTFLIKLVIPFFIILFQDIFFLFFIFLYIKYIALGIPKTEAIPPITLKIPIIPMFKPP